MTIMTTNRSQVGEGMMSTDSWTVAEAKARFSKLIEQAQSQGPQAITRHGRKTAIVVSAEEWDRKSKRTDNLAEFFATSPLQNSGLEVVRGKEGPRKIEL